MSNGIKGFSFSDSEKRIVTLLADALIPPTPKLPQKPSDLNLAADVEDKLFYASGTMRNLFRWGLRYLENRARLFRFQFKSFSEMGEKLRENYLDSCFESPLLHRRMLMRVFEAFILTNYYAHPEVARTIGYQVKLPNKTPSSALYGDRVILSLPRDETIEADVCIIGSGAGGAPIAADLAAAGLRVVILEEGGRFDLSDFKDDALDRSKRMYRDGGITTTVGIPPIVVPLGRTIGGTTTINSGTCFRTPPKVFEKWRNLHGLTELNEEVMGPYFEKVEKTIHVTPVPEEILANSARVIRRGLEKMGLKGEPLKRNVNGCEGSGLCCFGCPTDAKQSVQLNYIPQALAQGATLYAHCKVQRLLCEKDEVKEVIAQFHHPLTGEKGARLNVRAKVVVVATGTVQTPLLLKASGVGGRSGQLGRNLTLHPAGKALGLFDEEIRGWEGVPQSYSCADYTDQGIMFEGAFTPPSVAAPVFLLRGIEHKRAMENFSHMASFGFMITDESRGRVVRKPNGEALIFYSLGKNDQRKFIEGTVLLSRMFFEAGAKEVYLPVHPLPKITSIDEVSRLYSMKIKARDLDLLAFHPLGTCRMGKDPARSVLDPQGRVHEMKNLFVCDGSVFPSSLGVNPQVTIMAFSHRMGDYLKSRYF
ncbi:MAG: GMC family oxidoreductase N-terminal domain-containing protein [bacterium]